MSNTTAYALLIGVGEYHAFDPTGAADLEGPVNDVTAWLQLALDAGVPPAHIRICAEPAPALDALGARAEDITIGGATHAELIAALEWLAAHLDGKDGTKALLTWSGHGTHAGEVALLCPSDIAVIDDTLTHALSATEVQRIIDSRADDTRVTAMIDMCHTPWDGNRQTRALPWSGAIDMHAKDEAYVSHRVLGDLVLTSSAEGRASYELPVIAGVHGAFTFAVINLLRRWGRAGMGGGLTFAEVAERAGRVLESMGVPQTPRYVGADEGGELRVFSAIGDPTGSAEADALPGLEIHPGAGKVHYQLKDTSGQVFGNFSILDDDPPEGRTKNAQYWQFYSGPGPWPYHDFELVYLNKCPDLSGNLQSFHRSALDDKSGTVQIKSQQGLFFYAIKDSSSGPVKGYMKVVPGQSIEVFSTACSKNSGGIDAIFAADGDSTYFEYMDAADFDYSYTFYASDDYFTDP